MYDISETIYVQEQDPTHGDPQKVFGEEKEYLTDISPEIYKSLRSDFIIKNDGDPSNPK